jgi:hypothetical protein
MSNQDRKGAAASNPGHFATTDRNESAVELAATESPAMPSALLAAEPEDTSFFHYVVTDPELVVHKVSAIDGLPLVKNGPSPVGSVDADGKLSVSYLADGGDAPVVVEVAFDNDLSVRLYAESTARGDDAVAEFAVIAGFAPTPTEPLPGEAIYIDWDADRECFAVGDPRVEVSTPGLLYIGASPDLVARTTDGGPTVFAYLSDGYTGIEDSTLVVVTIDEAGTIVSYTQTAPMGYEAAADAINTLGGDEQANAPVPDSAAWL